MALLSLDLLIWAVLDTLHAEDGAQLRLDGLYGWGFYLLIGLFACAIVARARSAAADTRALLIPVLSVAPYVLTGSWLLGDIPLPQKYPAAATAAATAYCIALGVRTLQSAYGPVRWRPVLLAAAIIAAAPWALRAVDLDTRLWLLDDVAAAQSDAGAGAEAEPLLYEQPAKLVQAVERMPERGTGRPAVFYLGFAGDGEQEIFKREALLGARVFADRLGTADRSIELVNDEDDRESYPLATLSGLRQALKLIAARMNLEQDVLVLLLSSHGSRDGLAVVNGSLPLMQLSPSDLRQALDEAAIRWRIVIVSACYAGVFLDALKDEQTLVMTAADATHSSFGCDDDRDLTYFGEALLQDSLPRAKSLEQSFTIAAELIRNRESGEHEIHSNPQIAVGRRMHEKLMQLEAAARSSGQGTIIARQPR